MKLINYFKSFKVFIPTWFICVFFFFGVFGYPFLIGVALIIFQSMQKKKLINKKSTAESENKVVSSMMQADNIGSTNIIEKNPLEEVIVQLKEVISSKESIISNKEKELFSTKEILEKKEYELQLLRKKLGDMPNGANNFTLTAGKYKGGIDIPIGVYNFQVVFGTGNIEVNKPDNLYANVSNNSKDSEYGFISEYKNLEISDKTILKIRESAKVRFSLKHEYAYENEILDLNNKYTAKKNELSHEIDEIKHELEILNNELIQKYYIFSNYDSITSQDCMNQLAILKSKENEMRTNKDDFFINGTYSTKLSERKVRQALRCFNAECDNIILNISTQNVDSMRNKILKSYETINKTYSTDGIEISKKLLNLKLEQLTLLYTRQLKMTQEKEIQRAIKEQMVEEEKARRELEERKRKIEKDLQQFRGEVNRIMKYLQKTQIDTEKQLYIDKIHELEEHIKKLESDKETVLEREANAKAGFVYIISNIGSFGEDVYKIGMTRRLEPMDRIKELSSASVPFEFDVHAMIFSDDAPSVETMLHKHFEKYAINKVNPRKEFYKIDIDEIEQAVLSEYNNTVKFTKIPLATEYRQSIALSEI